MKMCVTPALSGDLQPIAHNAAIVRHADTKGGVFCPQTRELVVGNSHQVRAHYWGCTKAILDNNRAGK